MNGIMRKKASISIAVLMLGLATAAGCSVSGRAAAVDRLSEATLTFLTGLNADVAGKLAAGQLVRLADLPAESRSRVVESAKIVLPPQAHDERFGGEAVADDLKLVIITDFSVVIAGGALGPQKCVKIPLAAYLPIVDPMRKRNTVADVPKLSDPPTLESIMDAAPSGAVEHAGFLQARASALLDPIAAFRLTKAGVPVPLSRFKQSTPVKLSALDSLEADWLAGIYNQFCLRAVETSSKIRMSPGSTTLVVDGVPSEWLGKAPPVWSDLGDVTVTYLLEYGPALVPIDDSKTGGAGWMLPGTAVR